MAVKPNESVYGAEQISVKKGLEHVRLRPAMYIGDTGKKGLHHLGWEVLDNSIDEAMAGHATQITVTLAADGETLTIEDDGRGIPVGIHPDFKAEKRSALEVVLCELFAGGKFGGGGYEESGGLHGVGVSCVNALSDYLEARVWREGGAYQQKFSRGVPQTKTERISDSKKHGTAITFHADPEIFTESVAFDEDMLARRFKERAFLNAGLAIRFISKKTGRDDSFYYQGGIRDYVTYLSEAKTQIYPATPIYASGKSGNVSVEIAILYSGEDEESILCFANNISNPDGGTHLSGFKTALTRVVNQYARSANLLKEKQTNLSGDDIREGIITVISVKLPQPQFEGQTKGKLGSSEAESAVNAVLGEALSTYFEQNPAAAKMIINRAIVAQQARDARNKASDAVKRKSFLSKTPLPGKLADCMSEDRSQTELYICEGDSAAGTAKGGRNRQFQAVLPLRGKIINAEKNDLIALMNNEEVKSLIAAIGAGVYTGSDNNSFNLDNRRYEKVIILCDADVDGAHIATLLLAFFYRYMRPLVTHGHVYLAVSPLYMISSAKKKAYAFNKEERDAYVKQFGANSKVTRFKGLGEMEEEELGETAMTPGTRRLLRVSVSDQGEAEHMLSVLMGRNVAARKEHIVRESQLRAVLPEQEN